MPGQTLGIVGESGSGKSTLARLLCCLEKPDGGVLSCAAKRSEIRNEKNREVCRKIQMVFRIRSALSTRAGRWGRDRESLRNAGVPRKEAEKRVRQLLEQCGLPEEFAKRYPHEVSGGQCQRAAIARALAIEPQILICDEATSALDVAVQKTDHGASGSAAEGKTSDNFIYLSQSGTGTVLLRSDSRHEAGKNGRRRNTGGSDLASETSVYQITGRFRVISLERKSRKCGFSALSAL